MGGYDCGRWRGQRDLGVAEFNNILTFVFALPAGFAWSAFLIGRIENKRGALVGESK